MGPVILDMDSALADVSVLAESDRAAASHLPDKVPVAAADDDIQIYALARASTGDMMMSHVSHSSHSSHSSGASHYSHASHSSHASHASHVSGGYSTGGGFAGGQSFAGPSSSAEAPRGRPDLRIGVLGGALQGNNIYGTAKRQTVAQHAAPGAVLKWQVSLQNDAPVADTLRIQGAKAAHGFKVMYLAPNGANVTKSVVSGKFRTPRLASGATYQLTAVVTVTRKARRGKGFVGTLKATSVRSPSRIDRAAFVAKKA